MRCPKSDLRPRYNPRLSMANRIGRHGSGFRILSRDDDRALMRIDTQRSAINRDADRR
jgi:hypothetical protein